MKKWSIFLIIAFLLFCPTIGKTTATYAMEENTQEEISMEDIEDEVQQQLENLDFSSLDEILSSLSKGQIKIFGGTSFAEKIYNLITGKYDNGQGLWNTLIDIFLNNFLGLIPIISLKSKYLY